MKYKHTEFCSAVIKSRSEHFACMKRSTAVYDGRGFCKRHAPAFAPFRVYRFNGIYLESVLVYQIHEHADMVIVSPANRRFERIWGRGWHRTKSAALGAPLKEA